MLARVHLFATAVWSVLVGGAAAGFLARDALGLRQPLVALAWIAGAALSVLPFWSRREAERGRATVEFTLLVILAALALGGFLAFRVLCAVERE